MKRQIVLGTASIVLLIAALIWVAIGEEQRMATFRISYDSRKIEEGATLYENNCRSCHGIQGGGIEGVAPSLNTADLFNGERMASIGYTGSVEDYVRGVIAAGRPVPSAGASYPARMPTWGQEFGGPLRNDQVENLVAYVMNWKERALGGDQPARPPLAPGMAVGYDITRELPEGDAELGEQLVNSSLGCSACHILAPVGPLWAAEGERAGLGVRAATILADPLYSGSASSAEQYLFESVVLPNAHTIEAFQQVMPLTYGDRITPQEMADLIAYMLTFR